jgi:hypothetical protein
MSKIKGDKFEGVLVQIRNKTFPNSKWIDEEKEEKESRSGRAKVTRAAQRGVRRGRERGKGRASVNGC